MTEQVTPPMLHLTAKEATVLADALAMHLDVDSPEERAEMEADGQWLSAAESLRDRVVALAEAE